MTDTSQIWVALISAVPATMAAMTTAFLAWQNRSILKLADKTHTLVNSNMGVQLQLNSVVSRRLAANTKLPEDIEASKLADKLYQEHEKKQGVVDNKEEA